MSWTKKFMWSTVSITAAAVMALALLSTGIGTATAAVNGISASATTRDAAANSGTTECFVPVTFVAGAGIAGTNCATLTIDANTGDVPLQIVTTVGTIGVPEATGCTGGGCTVSGNGSSNVTITGGDVDTVTAYFAAPSTGPATASITVITGTTSKTVTITIRGLADKVEVSALSAATTAASTCPASDTVVIQSTTATIGQNDVYFCVLVKDAAGTRLANQPVIFTTTSGTLSAAAATTGTTGNGAVTVSMNAGTTGLSGTKGTVTISSGGKSTTLDIKFGGDPKSCQVTTNPATVTTGGSSVVNIDVKDAAATPGPVPDMVVVNVRQTNPGGGENAAILNEFPTTIDGKAQTTLIAAIPGAIALGASSGPPAAVISCTASVLATGQVVNPGGGPGGGTGCAGFIGTSPGRGSIGLLVTNGTCTAANLVAAFATAGCTVESLAVLEGGVWKIYINGAPAVVNAAFPASLAPTTAFFVRCQA